MPTRFRVLRLVSESSDSFPGLPSDSGGLRSISDPSVALGGRKVTKEKKRRNVCASIATRAKKKKVSAWPIRARLKSTWPLQGVFLPFFSVRFPTTGHPAHFKNKQKKIKTKKQSCCDKAWGIGDRDWGSLAVQRDLHFNLVPGVLTPAQSEAYLLCRQTWYDVDVGHYRKVDEGFPEYVPYTYGGECNMFGSVLFFIFLFVPFLKKSHISLTETK